ncbi:MAG: pentapeptide repeat-containing protein [Chitinophagaceae bacterium]
MEKFVEDQVFTEIDFTKTPLAQGSFDGCTFSRCDFSNLILGSRTFSSCVFTDCNLSLVQPGNTSFQEVLFKGCKMLGMRFDQCNDFGLSFHFEKCQLNHATFYGKKLKKITFRECQLQEVDFSNCDLTAATFDQCDLHLALFDQTALEKADLRTAYNYAIDPTTNRIRKAKFSLAGVPGLLHKFDIVIENK